MRATTPHDFELWPLSVWDRTWEQAVRSPKGSARRRDAVGRIRMSWAAVAGSRAATHRGVVRAVRTRYLPTVRPVWERARPVDPLRWLWDRRSRLTFRIVSPVPAPGTREWWATHYRVARCLQRWLYGECAERGRRHADLIRRARITEFRGAPVRQRMLVKGWVPPLRLHVEYYGTWGVVGDRWLAHRLGLEPDALQVLETLTMLGGHD